MVKKCNGRATSPILNKARVQWLCRGTSEGGYTSTPKSPRNRTWPPGNVPRPMGHLSSRACQDCYKVTSPTMQRTAYSRTLTRVRQASKYDDVQVLSNKLPSILSVLTRFDTVGVLGMSCLVFNVTFFSPVFSVRQSSLTGGHLGFKCTECSLHDLQPSCT